MELEQAKVDKATVGESYLIKFVQDPMLSKLSKQHQKSGEIIASCGENSSRGQWACLTHEVVFGNQMNKDGHIHLGTHRLAWWCPKCVAYEVP